MNNYTYTRQAIHRNVWAAIWPEISSEWYVNLLLVNNAVFLTNNNELTYDCMTSC